MDFKKIVVTPDLAATWLGKNTHNRRVSQSLVTRLAEDMQNGRWQFNGETIKLSGDRLLDGQHRLLACVKSGVSFDTIVATGIPESAFQTIDTGRARAVKDVMHIAGVSDPNRVTALLALIIRMESPNPLRNRPQSARVVMDRLAQEPDYIRECIAFGRKCWEDCRFAPQTAWAGARYSIRKVAGEAADRFLLSVAKGELLTADSPRLTLRRTLESIDRQAGSRDSVLFIAYIIKGWNLEANRSSVRRLTFQSIGPRSEEFPKPQQML